MELLGAVLVSDTDAFEAVAEFFAGEAEAALGGGFVGFHGVGDVRERNPVEMVQSEGHTLFGGQLFEEFVDAGGQVGEGGVFLGKFPFAGELRDRVLFLAAVVIDDADGVHQGIAGAAAGGIDHQVAGDTEHPSPESAQGQVIPALAVDFQESFLRQILGERPVAEIFVEESAEFRLIFVDQFVEGGAAAVLKTDHEVIVFGSAGVEVHWLRGGGMSLVAGHVSTMGGIEGRGGRQVCWHALRYGKNLVQNRRLGTRWQAGFRKSERPLGRIAGWSGLVSERTREMIHLSYGIHAGIDLEIEESRLQGVFRAPLGGADVVEMARAALNEPLDYPPLEQSIIPDDQIALVLDEDLPGMAGVLEAVWERLAARGVPPENLTILQAEGATFDPRNALPGEIRERVRWSVHTRPAEDAGELHYLATTAGGERIYLAEELVFADVVLTVGRIGFDPILGFRGTHSQFFPAFSSQEAFRRAQGQGHNELAPENDRPLRQLVDEIGWLLGAAYSVQVIPAGGGGVSRVLAGASESVLRRGRELLLSEWRLGIQQRSETVVVAVDHDAEGNGWERVSVALALAQRLVSRDGRIIVLSELAEPPGPGVDLLRHVEQPTDIVRVLREQVPPDLVAATQFATAVDWARVYLLSQLDGDLVEELFCVPVESGDEVARLLANTEDSCLFIESAQFADGRVG